MFERMEHRSEPLLPRARFAGRVAHGAVVAGIVIASSLAVGTAGYHEIAGLPWVDALLNASMILSGMGPVDRLTTPGAKVFASAYALFSGVVFISTAAILVAPALHRLMHRLHIEEDEGGSGGA